MFKRIALRKVFMAVLYGGLLWQVIQIPTALSAGSVAQETPASKTVWDGVYSAEQAARGKLEYENHCMNCHGPDLTDGRPLSGPFFLERWREGALDVLFGYVKAAMPRGAGGSLPDTVYLDIFTYLLHRNGFPEGPKAITIPELRSVDLIGKDGPKPVPDGALVATVGCLIRGSENEWLLTGATEPRRTREPYETTQAELSVAQASARGTQTFVLKDFDALPGAKPADFEGLRMQAKGFIVRQPGAERINLFHLGFISSRCPK